MHKECFKNFQFSTEDIDTVPSISEDKKILIAELQFSGVCCSLNIPPSNVNKLLNNIREIDQGRIWDSIRLGATKVRDLIVNVIGKEDKQQLVSLLKTTRFAICIDESTDVSKDKSLAVVVRLTDPITRHVECHLLEFVNVYTGGTIAKAGSIEIYNAIEKLLNDSGVPMGNIFAACFDDCPTMTGRISGLQSLLAIKIPGIINVRCPAHATHLCAKHAMKYLPSSVFDLIKNIYTMLKSSQRKKNFEKI